MDNFKAIYKILTALEACMDLPAPLLDMFSADALGVSEERWKKYICMLSDAGYIKDAGIVKYINGLTTVDCSKVQITLAGLEYLQENKMMNHQAEKQGGFFMP